ncbi:peroxisomal biogenesis factor 11 [Emericellopsis atlantica]|uniref:Peroxisomal biogenesis factor 11 n=1 Tax=Emericellopsis atlantica TaxID=2614577 RepID=A0A9P8CRY4_9HYPO|nr:peroxisomal biogenesis factor 11 [Emericellopsis atlantica]KAG9256827.1 peroxisomal biogenesis factor 11 [Emericellopsis atlantica]
MAGLYEHFVAFGVDNAGLERLMRLVQSFMMILTSYPAFLQYWTSTTPHLTTLATLSSTSSHLNLVRRWLRTFRFLDTLSTSVSLYMSQEKALDTWLSAHAATCLGIFGMLETITVLDLCRIEGLEVFGYKEAVGINLEAQRFWFVGLLLSACSTLVKLVRLSAYKPVPATGDGYGTSAEKDGKTVEERLREERKRRKDEKKAYSKKMKDEVTTLSVRFAADVMDLIIPATALGWVTENWGRASIIMFVTSVLTGTEVWWKVGKKLQKA